MPACRYHSRMPPAPRPAAWADRFLRSAPGRLIHRLRQGPATIVELSRATGLTANGVRVHLATLERDGWIHSAGVHRAPGPGKPATLYTLAPEAAPLLSNAYRPLLLALLQAMQGDLGPAERSRLLRAAGKALAAQQPEASGPLAERAAQLLGQLGAAVELEQSRGPELVLRGVGGCPLDDAVRLEPKVCGAVTTLLGAALDARVVEQCERSPDGRQPARCRFQISPRRGA